MRAATKPQNRRSASTPKSERAIWAANALASRNNRTPRTGMRTRTAASATIVAMKPASPKLRMRSELENCKATKDRAAVAWVRTQAGPTIKIALVKASNLFSPASNRSRVAKVSCILSEKLITMMRGVITLRRKSSQPSAPSANNIAIRGGPAAMIMKETRRKKGSR